MLSMGDLQDPKMEVRKRTIFLAIYILWGYSLKFRPDKYQYAKIYDGIGTSNEKNRFLKFPLMWGPPVMSVG